MNRIILFLSLATFCGFCSCSQPRTSNPVGVKADEMIDVSGMQIAFYNVENLFDTINNEGVKDEEYTPESDKEWNTEKFSTKLARINQVLSSVDSSGRLVVIGLCEVENRGVVEDLINSGFLGERDFQIVHKESPDARGIDVALIYDPKYFSPESSSWKYVQLPDSNRETREILRWDAQLNESSWSFYVNHWPSRWGGTEQSEPKRLAAAKTLRSDLDDLLTEKPEQNIVVMGDFNDHPDNNSMLQVLAADSSMNSDLYNATWPIHKIDSIGSHNYKGDWGQLDQMVVSKSLIPMIDTTYVLKKRWMCYENKSGKWLPSRSFGGSRYYGGYSDHLPVILKLK